MSIGGRGAAVAAAAALVAPKSWTSGLGSLRIWQGYHCCCCNSNKLRRQSSPWCRPRLFVRGSAGTGEDPRVDKEAALIKRRNKQRLDEMCLRQSPQYSKSTIQSWITQGKVFVDGKKVVKAGTLIKPTADLDIRAEEPKFVCRAGAKLEAALDHYQISVDGCVALDAGLSTGGFTDCLLQKGALLVYGVDVGYGQAAEKVRTHPQVVVMERTNLRHVEEIIDEAGQCRVFVDIVTLDLSFISVLLVMDAVKNVLKPSGILVVLIKPQFEAKREQVGKGGIIRDAKIHEEVITTVSAGVEARGFRLLGPPIESPIKGGKGNKEFLAAFQMIASTS